MLLDGCHEGQHTPRLSDEKCECGYVLRAGSYEGEYERGGCRDMRGRIGESSFEAAKDFYCCFYIFPLVE